MIVAAGARDLALAFPGWDRPGVMGARGADAAIRLYQAFAGRRLVVLGAGVLGTSVALSAQEVKAVAAADRQRNVNACMEALPDCNPLGLTQAEMKAVRANSKARNLSRCLSGSNSCDPFLLSDSEAHSVAASRRRKNVESCTNGFFAKCDIAMLTAPELAATTTAVISPAAASRSRS